jgi:hypothetical protein
MGGFSVPPFFLFQTKIINADLQNSQPPFAWTTLQWVHCQIHPPGKSGRVLHIRLRSLLKTFTQCIQDPEDTPADVASGQSIIICPLFPALD